MDGGFFIPPEDDDGDERTLLAVAVVIRAALADGIDPYALVGVLVEGAVYAVTTHVPMHERSTAGAAVLAMLQGRMKALGAI